MTVPGDRSGRRRGRPTSFSLALVLLAAATPVPTSAQLSAPCEATCAAVLGVTGFTAATGTLVAYGRQGDGVSTLSEGLTVWGIGLVGFVGGGLALSGDGRRQERAVYAAGIGALVGSVLWLGIESTLAESDRARKVAATLMGAAAGALVGGVYGALSHEGNGSSIQASLLSVRIPF